MTPDFFRLLWNAALKMSLRFAPIFQLSLCQNCLFGSFSGQDWCKNSTCRLTSHIRFHKTCRKKIVWKKVCWFTRSLWSDTCPRADENLQFIFHSKKNLFHNRALTPRYGECRASKRRCDAGCHGNHLREREEKMEYVVQTGAILTNRRTGAKRRGCIIMRRCWCGLMIRQNFEQTQHRNPPCLLSLVGSVDRG